MATPANLLAVMTALETAAGATTSANDSQTGRWKRIAAAAETIAGATSTANASIEGYMLRTAVALEAYTDVSTATANRGERGLMLRIVNALESLGDVGTGSLDNRLVAAAQGASFGLLTPLTLTPDTTEEGSHHLTVGTLGGYHVDPNALDEEHSIVVVSQSNTLWFDLLNEDGEIRIYCIGEPDFETNASPTITLRETYEGETLDTVITIHVTDSVDFNNLTLDNDTVAEGQAGDVAVGNVLGGIASGYQSVIIAQSNSGWFFDEGYFLSASGPSLDFETNPSPTVTYRECQNAEVDPLNPVGPYHDTVLTIHVTNVAENLYPDPALTGSYTTFGGGAHSSGQHTFTAATNSGLVSTSGATNTALVAVTAASTQYDISVNLSGYTGGNLWVRMWQGTYVQLTPSANGIATATVTSGTTNTVAFNFRGDSGAPATVNVTPTGGVAITIVPH